MKAIKVNRACLQGVIFPHKSLYFQVFSSFFNHHLETLTFIVQKNGKNKMCSLGWVSFHLIYHLYLVCVCVDLHGAKRIFLKPEI